MNQVIVTAAGADRPGIVAAVTGALLEIGGNLEETRAALLRGSFATVLAVAVPDEVGPEDVAAALRPVADELGLGIWVGAAAARPAGPPQARWVLSVYGADHPGIVHGMAVALAEHDANIIDLSSRLVGEPPVYVLGIEFERDADRSVEPLTHGLRGVAERHGVEMSLEPEDDEVL